MRIKHLTLENYRGFEKLEMELPEKGSAVFIGVNGAGKSSILAAIKMIFAKIVEREKPSREFLSELDVRLGTLSTEVELVLSNSSEKYENLRVEERPFNKFTSAPSSLVITKSGKDLNLAQMSDGEKMVVTVVGDIAHRLTLANPALKSKLHGTGVVLIDEIELHLHPSWQRSVIPALEATFPNIQFIATTHSPQVLSSVKQENVIILEDFQIVEKTPHTFGRDSNSLLQDLFNVAERPEKTKEEFRRLYRLMDDPEKVGEANDMLEEMEGKYGSDDPEIIRARMHQEFMNEE